MTARALVVACACAALLAGCGGGHRYVPADTAKVIDSIKSDEVRWNADWRSGDADRLTAHFAPDAVVMVSGAPIIAGTPAIRSATAAAIDQPGFKFTFASERVEVAASGDQAAARGAYRMTSADPKTGAVTTETGSYVTLYKPGADGVWKAFWDISAPGPAAPAPAPAENPKP